MYKINHQDIKKWTSSYKGELFDGVLCDPPYELGFMGKSWDSTGIAYDSEMWRGIFDLLKPGAHLLAFSGSRTYHRMAVAIEDAGFEIRDQLIWMYGSGFPKSLNIGKAVDKIQGNEREELDERGGAIQKGSTNWQGQDRKDGKGSGFKEKFTDTKGTSEWEGYGTALKPAHEPCVLARKPIEGTVANNVLKHGTGGLNIDGTRIEAEPELAKNWTNRKAKAGFGNAVNVFTPDTTAGTIENFDYYKPQGRFPANLIHDGSDEVEAVFPRSKGGAYPAKRGQSSVGFASGKQPGDKPAHKMGDDGSASRYFYTAKASKSERNAGLEGFEEKVNGAYDGNVDTTKARKIGANPERQNVPTANGHPTVKPLSLTKYLATLIKPPSGGRLLVPFSGSGSEMIGALQAGWEYVEGVELTEEYIPIAEARIKYWLEQEKNKQEALL